MILSFLAARVKKEKGSQSAVTGKEEMNSMLIEDKSVPAVNSEENGSHGTADGGSQGQNSH